MYWLVKDLRVASRILKNDPWFSLLNILVIAVGSAMVIFALSLSNTTVFEPLAMNGSAEIYYVEATTKGEAELGGKIHYSDYVFLKEQSTSLVNVGAYYLNSVAVGMGKSSERFSAAYVTPEMFEVTAERPLTGRVFNPEDGIVDSAKIVILGEKLAAQLYSSMDAAIGQKLAINGQMHQIVGVLAQQFEFPVRQQLWLPLRELNNQNDRTKAARVAAFAQLAPGVRVETAITELDNIAQRLATLYPQSNRDLGFYLSEFKKGIVGESGVSMMNIILTAAFVVLFLSCVNVASLLSVRGNKRIKQTSVQIAMGAPRYRIIAQIVAEAFLICSLGAAVGLFLALFGLRVVQELINGYDEIPFWWQLGLTSSTVLSTFTVILVASLISGIWPALKSSEGNFNQVLRDGTRGALGKSSAKFSYVVVFIELTLSFVILIFSGLQVAQMDFINNASYGVTVENRVVGRIDYQKQSVDSFGNESQLLGAISDRLKQIDVVEHVAFSTTLPGSFPRKFHYQVEGVELSHVGAYPYVNPIYVSDNYLTLYDIKLIAGRALDSRDNVEGVNNVLIEQTFAEQAWPNASPLGKRFRCFDGDKPGQWMTVVGITSHAIYGQVQSNALYRYSFYAPLSKTDNKSFGVAIKTSAIPNELYQQLREKVYQVDQNIPLYDLKTQKDLIKENAGGAKFMSGLFSLIAIAALILSGSCIFAVIAYLVSQRSHEIAVRQALGAHDWNIHKLYFRKSFVQFVIAAIIGLGLGYLVSQFVDTTEFAAKVPLVFAAVFFLMLGLVALATVVPVGLTLRKEPAEVLKDI
jgi:putative ABC transport system permease protein